MTQDCERMRRAGERGAWLFGHGFHCAEAVAWSVMEALGRDPAPAARCATPFGGGFGKTHAEACGALCGGLIAVGMITGRSEPGGSWDDSADLAAELRKRFVARFETTCCGDLRTRFGQNHMAECRLVVEAVIKDALECLAGKE